MKWLLVIPVIFSMMLITSQNLLVYLDFKWNQDYIASTMCINKDKPEMKCNGKCHLSKILKELEQDREDQKTTVSQVKLELIDHTVDLLKINHPTLPSYKTHIFNYTPYIIKSLVSEIFHPPRL